MNSLPSRGLGSASRPRSRLVLFSCVVLFIVTGLAVEAFAQERLEISPPKVVVKVGHILGCSEAMFVDRVMSIVPNNDGDLYINVDQSLAGSYSEAADRFGETTFLADLVFLYAGQTSQIEEIHILAKGGRLEAMEELPDFAARIRPGEIHSNLLAPVQSEGHTWALPVRVSAPCLTRPESANASDEKLLSTDIDSFRADHPSDPYPLWRTVCAARGNDLVVEDEYVLDAVVHEAAFGEVAQLMSRRVTWAAAGRAEAGPGGQGAVGATGNDTPFGIVVPDTVINNMFKLRGAKYYEYPAAPAAVYTPENTWYIGVSSSVAPEKLPAITEILAAVTGPEIQMFIARVAFSPPVRPSIANSAEFKAAFPEGSIQRVLADTAPRLRLRKGGPGREEAETILEDAFNQALERPDEFLPLLSAAVNAANEACFHSAAR